jgi:putative tricarboxylic transport membrane protein
LLEALLAGFEAALRVDTFIWMSAGLLLGMLMGAMPGFTTTMGMSVLMPIAFLVGDPLIGIPFLIGVYKGGIYGGSVPAILISMPGTAASVVTVMDGHELTKKGQPRKALDMGLAASVISDFISDFLTLILIIPVAAIVLGFGPPEIAAIMFLSLVIVSVTATGPVLKGLLMLGFGFWLSFVGADPFSAMERYTFGTTELYDGFHLIPMLIGLFALPEIFNAVRAGDRKRAHVASLVGDRLSWTELKASLRTIFRSTGIGTAVGLVPGLGQTVAAMMGYIAAKNASKHPETFGKGDIDGVAAAEAANNAVNGPTMVPLLTLGIPGDNVTVIGHYTIPLFSRVVTIKKSLLIPITIMLAFTGTYLARSNPFDLVTLVGFGIIGLAARRAAFDVMPMVMGFILGRELEYSFGQTISLAGDNLLQFALTERLGMTAIVVATPILGTLIGLRMNRLRRQELIQGG